MKEFLLDYVQSNQSSWISQPVIYADDTQLHDAIVLVFGKPRTAIFAHMDSIGYTTRYENQLVAIGGPSAESGTKLVGKDSLGPIECTLKVHADGTLTHDFARSIQRGTTLVYKPDFRLSRKFVQSPYMDNRLGIYAALKVAETLEDGIIAFSTYEEHAGGSVPMILQFLQKNHPISQALISDITWVTDGVQHHEGVVISMRDRNIPRRTFLNRIIRLADESGIPYQLEVEGSGSSDGREVQLSPHPIDWCFIGAPEDHVHTPDEKVSLEDIESMINMYKYLMKRL